METMSLINDPDKRTDDPFKTFRSLSQDFQKAYFEWHTRGQYEGVQEFGRFEDVLTKPPLRERDDWYGEELRVIDRHYRPLIDSRILEIGCGDGNLTWKLAERSQSVVSCDVDPSAIELTRLRLKEKGLIGNVELLVGSADYLASEESEAYDVVFLVQVLEHMPASMQGGLFDSVLRLVAPGGCLFVSTPNRWAIRDSHDTGRLLIHWFPRRIRIPLAKAMKWGIKGQDPCWPSPPVLHDYTSYRWMLKRVESLFPGGMVPSRMLFYPTAEEWFREKVRIGSKGTKHIIRHAIRYLGDFFPLNYYFGDKVIFYKMPRGQTTLK